MSEWVGTMDLVQIDHIDTQTTQRCFTGRHQIRFVTHVGHTRNDPALGCYDYSIAQTWSMPKDVSQHVLARSESSPAPIESIDIGVVDQGHTAVDSRLDEISTAAYIRIGQSPAPKGHGADISSGNPARRRSQRFVDTHHSECSGATWWGGQGSNPRPRDYESPALTN
jgi:hypothetical protein